MVRIMFFLIFWVVFMKPVQAQNTWIKTYGGNMADEGWDVQQTEDGGYVVVGRTNSFGKGSYDVYVIKTDEMGDTLWTKTYGDSLVDSGFSINQVLDQGYIIIGHLTYGDPAKCGIYMIRTDVNGDTLWTRNHRRDINAIGWAGQQTADGGYVAAGSSIRGGILIKTNESGDTLWTRIYDEAIIYKCYDVHSCEDEGYILTGESRGLAALVKTDSWGRILWSKHFGAKRLDRGYSVRQTRDGGYILTGIQYIPGGLESTSCVFLVKTDAAGDTLWTRRLGEDNSAGNCVRQTKDGGYILTGFIHHYEIGLQVYLIKTDEFGVPIWSRVFGRDEGCAVRETDDGGYIIAETKREGGTVDVILIKTDESGCITSVGDKKHNQELPSNFRLYQNCPNPFNHETRITYRLEYADDVELSIFNIQGAYIKILHNERKPAGLHSVRWDGTDQKGHGVSSGVYLYKLEVGKRTYSKKLLFCK